MIKLKSQPWWLDSSEQVSGKPGAIQGEIFALDNSGNCVFAIIDSEIPNFQGKPSNQTLNLFLTTISFDGINANEAYRIDSFTNDKIVYITEDINGEIETLTLTR